MLGLISGINTWKIEYSSCLKCWIKQDVLTHRNKQNIIWWTKLTLNQHDSCSTVLGKDDYDILTYNKTVFSNFLPKKERSPMYRSEKERLIDQLRYVEIWTLLWISSDSFVVTVESPLLSFISQTLLFDIRRNCNNIHTI